MKVEARGRRRLVALVLVQKPTLIFTYLLPAQ